MRRRANRAAQQVEGRVNLTKRRTWYSNSNQNTPQRSVLSPDEFRKQSFFQDFVNIRSGRRNQTRRTPIARTTVSTQNRKTDIFWTRTTQETEAGTFATPPPTGSRVFQTTGVPPHNRSADFDHEANAFEIAHSLLNGDQSDGVLEMIVDKAMCFSCQGVADQFAVRYPNITVRIIEMEDIGGAALKEFYDEIIP